MNDLEHEIRDALRRHEGDTPSFGTAEARRAAGRAHRRQVRNVVVGGIVGAAVVVVAVAGLGELVRADQPPTVIDHPSPSPTCVAPGPDEATVYPWPDNNKNLAGVYSLDRRDNAVYVGEGFMHNGYSHSPGEVSIYIQFVPRRLIPHRGQTAATLAGCEGTYRRFTGKDSPSLRSSLDWDDSAEEWMVNIRGTTVTVTLAADPRTPDAELAEAHEIIESIRAERWDNDLGFRLIFRLTTNTWDSG